MKSVAIRRAQRRGSAALAKERVTWAVRHPAKQASVYRAPRTSPSGWVLDREVEREVIPCEAIGE